MGAASVPLAPCSGLWLAGPRPDGHLPTPADQSWGRLEAAGGGRWGRPVGEAGGEAGAGRPGRGALSGFIRPWCQRCSVSR